MASIVEAQAKRPTIAEFRIGKGRTGRLGEAEEWERGYLELTVRLPEWFTEEDFLEALSRAEELVDRWLKEKEEEKEKEREKEAKDQGRESEAPIPVPAPAPVHALSPPQASASALASASNSASIPIPIPTLASTQTPATSKQAPRSLDPKAIEALPWKERDGSPSKPGNWGWIHGPGSFQGPEPEASGLIRALDASPEGRIALGDYEYAYSREKVFIHRRPRIQNPYQSQSQSQIQNEGDRGGG
jgi:hypothetical protein